MSDELIEGRTLRGAREPEGPLFGEETPPGLKKITVPPEAETSPAGRAGDAAPPEQAPEEAGPAQEAPPSPEAEPSPAIDELPYVALDPPPEAGDVIRSQTRMPTRINLPQIEFDPEDLPWEIFEAPPFEELHASPPEIEQAAEPEPPPPMEEAPEPEEVEDYEPPVLDRRPARKPEPRTEQPGVDSLMRLPAVRLEDDKDEPAPSVPAPPPPAEVEPVAEERPEAEPPAEPELPAVAPREPLASTGELDPVTLHTPAELQRIDPDASHTAHVPPVHNSREESLDMEWVVEVGEQLQEESQPAPPAPAQYREPEQAPDRSPGRVPRWLLIVIGLAVLAGLVIAVVFGLRFFGGDGQPEPPTEPGEGTPAGQGGASEQSGSAAFVGSEQTPDRPLLPYEQGKIAFASNRDGDFEIYVLDMVSRELTQITDNDHADRSPAWSPDGTRILYVSDQAGDDDLYVMNADGSGVVQLTTDASPDHFPAWSPDGSMVVFSRETAAGGHLLTFDAACMSREKACEDETRSLIDEGHSLHGHWSPDGKQIVFTYAEYPGEPSGLALADPESGEATLLIGTEELDFYPVWSPDGEQIAFVSNALDSYDLWLMNAADGALSPLTTHGRDDVEPGWSPDGSYLVFASDRSGIGFDLYLIAATCEGSEEGCEETIILLTEDDADDLDPDWTGQN